ncbi:MAG: hypothetical protein AAGA56_25990 [Myxococcota bacterium]
MTIYRYFLIASLALAVPSVAACDDKAKDDKSAGDKKSSDKNDAGKKGDEKDDAKSGNEPSSRLAMSSESDVCKKAMKCCEERVKLETGGTKSEDINLKCSGVAMAKTDDECKQFAKGYAMSLEAGGKTVPASCK